MDQCDALRSIIDGFGSEKKAMQWSPDCCSMNGVVCVDSHIVSISWTNSNLSGEISNAISKLDKLEGLFLTKNNITGGIPEEIGSLTDLRFLKLGNNRLTGKIPNSLLNLTKLEILDLSSNSLDGKLPCFNINNIELRVYNNQRLTGGLEYQMGKLLNIENTDMKICSKKSKLKECEDPAHCYYSGGNFQMLPSALNSAAEKLCGLFVLSLLITLS